MATDLVHNAVQLIVTAIADGRFAQGCARPREAELAEMFAVSRLTMREAVRILSDRGVLDVRRGRGTYVAPQEKWSDPATLIAVLASQTDQRTLGIQLIEVRRMIEVGATGLAATHRTSTDIEHLQHWLAAYSEASQQSDIDAALTADIAFHDAILTASHNPLIPVMMSSLASAVARSRRSTTELPDVRKRAAHHHRLIFEAIAAGDASAAKQAMRAHMTQTRNDILLVTKTNSMKRE